MDRIGFGQQAERVGRTAVQLILNRFAGRWEITEYLRNPSAVSFWRRVVALYTQGNYQERIVNGVEWTGRRGKSEWKRTYLFQWCWQRVSCTRRLDALPG